MGDIRIVCAHIGSNGDHGKKMHGNNRLGLQHPGIGAEELWPIYLWELQRALPSEPSQPHHSSPCVTQLSPPLPSLLCHNIVGLHVGYFIISAQCMVYAISGTWDCLQLTPSKFNFRPIGCSFIRYFTNEFLIKIIQVISLQKVAFYIPCLGPTLSLLQGSICQTRSRGVGS